MRPFVYSQQNIHKIILCFRLWGNGMRIAAIFLYLVLIMPVHIHLQLFFSLDALFTGAIDIFLWQYKIPVLFDIVRRRRSIALRFHFPWGDKQLPLKWNRTMHGKVKTSIAKKWRNACRLLQLSIGTGDAALTAIVCGMLMPMMPVDSALSVRPDYQAKQCRCEVLCILDFRLGKLFLSAAQLGASRLFGSVREG